MAVATSNTCNYGILSIMKVLLTGASGFLGKNITDVFSLHGVDSVVIGRQRPTHVHESKFFNIDILECIDFEHLVKLSGATHLLHLAWYTDHGKCWESPINLRWVDSTVRLVEAFCRSGGQQVVIAGTCAEYDWSFGYCKEDHTPLKPSTLYGIAKDASRRLVTAICDQYEIPCAWGRIFFPYGPGEDSRRLIPALMKVFDGHRVPFGVNAGIYRDFIHAKDVATGFLTLLQKRATGAFNISTEIPTKIGTVVELLASARSADPQIVLKLLSARKGEPAMLVGDNHKLKDLGWEPKYYLEEMIRSGRTYQTGKEELE